MAYPLHPDFPEPPYPETDPCFVCGRERGAGHDLAKHVDPELGTPTPPIGEVPR